MGRTKKTYALTWVPYRWTPQELRDDPTRLPGRWVKKHKGKQIWLGLLKGETKESSYQRCLAEFMERVKKQDQSGQEKSEYQRTLVAHLDSLFKKRDQARQDEDAIGWRSTNERIKILQGWLTGEEEPVVAADLVGGCPWEREEGAAVEHEKTLGAASKRFLELTDRQHERGDISAARYETIKRGVDLFVELLGEDFEVAGISTAEVSRFHKHLDKEGQAKKWSQATLQLRWTAARQFIGWLYSEEILENEPRNLKKLGFTVDAKEIRQYPPGELKLFLADDVDEKTRLYLLLMLNCGMHQGDISDLKPSEVDWTERRIERRRSKTADCEDVPKVNYKLWPVTFALLQKHRANNEEHVLLSKNSTPLRYCEKTEKGMSKGDVISMAYHRAAKRLKIDHPKQLKLIRKTSSSLLANKYDEALAEHFLGHVPMGIGRRHYLVVDQARFDEAIRWLGEQFGIISGQAEPTNVAK